MAQLKISKNFKSILCFRKLSRLRSFFFYITFLFVFIASIQKTKAEEIPVPIDELARDSVYPVFDNNVSVRNRNVKDFNTFDVGVFGGLAITEPVYNSTKFGVSLNYHFNETHSLGFIWAQNSVGLSCDAEIGRAHV